MNVAHFLEASARHLPDRTALLFGAGRFTFAELDREAGRVAAGLARLGLRPGERACLHIGNRPEFVLAYFGCQKLGVTPVALNVAYVRDELAYIIRDSEAAAVVSGPPFAAQLPPAAETASVRVRVGTGEPGAPAFGALLADPPLRARDADRDDVAAVLYTSATTGRPKGVMLTHANVVSNTHATVHHLGMTPDDRGLCALPLFHCFGQNFIMNALVAAGGTLVLHERFVPADFAAAIARHRVTILYAVPTMYIVLLAGGLAASSSAGPRRPGFRSPRATASRSARRSPPTTTSGPIVRGPSGPRSRTSRSGSSTSTTARCLTAPSARS
jgi:long-chain acyl-CoA synthetase